MRFRRRRWLASCAALAVAAAGLWAAWWWQVENARRWLDGLVDPPSHYGTQVTVVERPGGTLRSTVRIDYASHRFVRWEYLGPDLAGATVVNRYPLRWRYDPQLGVSQEVWGNRGAGRIDPGRFVAWVRGGRPVAGRETVWVWLWRPGQERQFWLDRDTGVALRYWTQYRDGTTSDTAFTEFHLGERRPAPEIGTAGQSSSPFVGFSESEAAIAKRLGIPVLRPRYLPAGFEHVQTYLFRCPCGCGMAAAQLVFSDGLSWISLFESDRNGPSCIGSSACCRGDNAPSACVVTETDGQSVVARLDRQPAIVAVGDVSRRELVRVIDSVP